MWYLGIILIAVLTFLLSPWEPLLQASNRERVAYKNLQFPLFTPLRVCVTLLGASSSLALYHLVSGAVFLLPLFAAFGVVYAYDFVKAARIAKQFREGQVRQLRREG